MAFCLCCRSLPLALAAAHALALGDVTKAKTGQTGLPRAALVNSMLAKIVVQWAGLSPYKLVPPRYKVLVMPYHLHLRPMQAQPRPSTPVKAKRQRA